MEINFNWYITYETIKINIEIINIYEEYLKIKYIIIILIIILTIKNYDF